MEFLFSPVALWNHQKWLPSLTLLKQKRCYGNQVGPLIRKQTFGGIIQTVSRYHYLPEGFGVLQLFSLSRDTPDAGSTYSASSI